MALSIEEAPIYGGNTLVIELSADTQLSVDASFYIVYEGSQQRHVTSARRLTSNKLHSIVPGHDEAETVRLSTYSYLEGEKNLLLSTGFTYRNDGAFFLAQFLIDSVYNPQILEDLELIKSDHFDLSNEDTSTLDRRLSRALGYLDIPEWWSLLGSEAGQAEPQPRETLLHFAARLGLSRVAGFLITKPGAQTALRLPNRHGNLPRDVALVKEHPGLAELLSEYNAHGFMPLGSWLDTDQGTIQTQETGDISFTSKILKHERTLEEDIALLKEIQQKLEDADTSSLRQWQTHWPEASQIHTDNETDLENRLERKFENICQKAQELPNIISMETIDDYRDSTGDNYSDPNISAENQEPSGSQTQPEEDNIAMETLPELHISEETWEQEHNTDYMEGNVSALRGYNEHLQRIREKSVVFKRILEQDLRKDNLARFSSSCPSLDVDDRDLLPTIDEDTCKSMLDLVKDGERPAAGSTGSVYSEELYSSGNDLQDQNVHIVVDGVTTEESTEGFDTKTQEYDEFLNEFYGGNIPNVRRRSFSPKAVNRSSKDGENLTQDEMLAENSKQSVGFNSLEGKEESEEDESFQDATDVPSSAHDLSASASPKAHKRAIVSTGDIEEISNEEQDTSATKDGSTVDASNMSVKRSTKKGRGQGQSVRYSADIEHLMHRHQAEEGLLTGKSLDDSQRPATPQSGNSTEEEGGPLTAPHSKMTKALSTSSIPAATKAEGHKGISRRGFNRETKQQDGPSHLLIQRLIAEHDAQFRRQAGIEEHEEECESPIILHDSGVNKGRMRRKGQVSLIDFLNEDQSKREMPRRRLGHVSMRGFYNWEDPANFSSSDGSASPVVPKEKEEKKRKISMFSRFHNSVRTKKGKEKENKSKSTHQFVPVSFSNNTPCDVCNKALANKPAIRCEVCMLSVHENTCKEQITPCGKFRSRGHHGDSDGGGSGTEKNGHQSSSVGVSYLRPSHSFKEKSQTRPASAYVGSSSAQIPIPSAGSTVQIDGQPMVSQNPRRSLPTPSLYGNSPNAGTYLQWRRASVSVDRAITEEGEQDGEPGLDLGHQTNMTSTISQSIESLDEVDSVGQEVGCDDNDLQMLITEEPETWTATADKKVLKRMNAKDVKRQDTIWELIQTERHHCKYLKILQRFFRDDMIKHLLMPQQWVDMLFPKLDDLINIHMTFLQQLQDLQNKRSDHTIEEIGPSLLKQFSGESSEKMKDAYGSFCSGHLLAVQLYKDELAKSRKFSVFIKQRTNHPVCQKREIPDFILLVTQRPTKYPTLIEAIIKSTRDKKDKEHLLRALDHSKDVLQNVNETVAEAERQMRLQDIFQKTDTRSTGMKAGKKFKKFDLISNGRRLLYEACMGWRNARGKYTDVMVLVLTDVLVFMQESNQKYVFFSQDSKFGVVSLFNLLVREKGDTRDSKGMYLISQNKQMPEMYELICKTSNERHECIKKIRTAVEKCPEEEEEVHTVAEEEKRKLEERNAKAKQIIEMLQQQDDEIKARCETKSTLMLQLLSIYSGAEEQQSINSRPNSRELDDAMEHSGTLQAAIQEVSIAASQLSTMLQGNSSNLSRSVSSVGEHTSQGYSAIPIPKRAETFAGFDSPVDLPKLSVSKKRGQDAADYSESPSSSLYQGDSESDLTQYTDLPGTTYPKYDPSDVESGRGSSPGALSSVSALSPVTGPLEQTSVAQLLKTLNSIVHLTASQGTAVETLRAQLCEANERINKLSADVHEKKSGYRHNQLEELRNLQGQVQKEKQEWEKEKERASWRMEQERASLEDMRKSLEHQEAEIKAQKEDLRKQREVLQRQTEMLQAQGRLPRDAASSSQLAGTSAPGTSTDTSDKGNVQSSSSDFQPGHRRSASLETYSSAQSSDTDQNHKSVPKIPKESFRSEARPSISKLQSFSVGNKQNLPIHLLSATNEQKIGSKSVQRIPSKLSNSVSTSAVGSHSAQSLPYNVKSMSGGNHGNVSHDHSGAGQQSHGGDQYSQFGHSQSAGNLGNYGNGGQGQGQNRNLVSTASVPMAGRQSNRPKTSSSLPGLSGVMKLAEKGEKKGKTSSQGGPQVTPPGPSKGAPTMPQQQEQNSGPRPTSVGSSQGPRVKHKPQKSDSDVIYF